MRVTSEVLDSVLPSSALSSLVELFSIAITVFFVYDELGNILIDENGRFMLVDENGTPIGW